MGQNFFIGMDDASASSLDQRKQPRIPFSGKGKIVSEARPVEITVGNISLSGVLFHAQPRFDLGKQLTLRINGEHGGKSFEEQVAGRIMAAHRGDQSHSYGLQFLNHLTADQQPCLFAKIDQVRKQKQS